VAVAHQLQSLLGNECSGDKQMASRDKEIVDDEEEPVKVPSKKKKGIFKWIMISLGIVLLVGVSVGTSIYFMSTMLHGASSASEDKKDASSKAKDDKGRAKQSRVAIYYKLDPPFVVNFQGATGNRFLQVTIEIMTYDPEVVPAVEQHMPVIRNNIVFLLSSVNYDQVSTLEGKQKLRADTLTEIQKILKDKIGKPGVEEVYFTSIVMQ
jgi:flagellar FliL protein